jgi:hypothetical protein
VNYERMDQAPLVSHLDVAAFVRHRKLSGPGIGWIDAHCWLVTRARRR